jgi:hypothetical protein
MSDHGEDWKHSVSEEFGLPLKKRVNDAAKRVIEAVQAFAKFVQKPAAQQKGAIEHRVRLIINRLQHFTKTVKEKAEGRWKSLKETWTERPICFVFAVLAYVVFLLIKKAGQLAVRGALRMCFSALFGVRAELLRGVTDAFADYGVFFFFNGLIYKWVRRVDRKIDNKAGTDDGSKEKKVFDDLNHRLMSLREEVSRVVHHPKEASNEYVARMSRMFDEIQAQIKALTAN